ncbi:MAG: hypothetical protein H5T72_07160 [Actinobacteria bacterium]|nr:hypothetical protein [Actinomycetota bacterium]
MFVAHLDNGMRMHSRIPFPFNILGNKYEYVLMGILGWMTDADWLYRYRVTAWMVDKLANRVVLPLIHGEVLDPAEVKYMLRRLEEEGHAMALGTCERRRGPFSLEHILQGPSLFLSESKRGHLTSRDSAFLRFRPLVNLLPAPPA